jgi:WD40 repeat protein
MVNLWGLKNAVLLRSFGPHDGEVHSVDISPDGRVLAVCDGEWGVTLWDADHGEEIVSLRRSARLVAFTPKGGLLATAWCCRSKVTIWNILLQQWPDQACERTNRNLTCGEWRQYLGDIEASGQSAPSACTEDCNPSAGSNQP